MKWIRKIKEWLIRRELQSAYDGGYSDGRQSMMGDEECVDFGDDTFDEIDDDLHDGNLNEVAKTKARYERLLARCQEILNFIDNEVKIKEDIDKENGITED